MTLNKIKINDTTTVNTGVVYDITKATSQSYDSLSAALGTNGNNVPSEVREGGMSIRFVSNSDNKYVQYRLAASIWSTDINDWTSEDPYFIDKIMQEVNEAIDENTPIEIHGDVTNAPDEEDLTSVNVGDADVLKFKDKAYNPLTYSGLGRKYLRKNIVDGVNTLTQEMVSDANTIYIIRYDFDLGGEIVTIPKYCVLEFDGGSLSNGTLCSKYSTIVAPNRRIFNNIDIPADNFYVEEVLVDWFYNDDLGNAFTKAMHLLPNFAGTIKCSSAKYNLTTPCLVKSDLFVNFNSCVINVNSSVPAIADLNYGFDTPYSVSYTKIHNVNIYVKVKPNSNYYTIDVANSANCEYNNIVIKAAYENIESEDKMGIAIGRIANGYNGTRSCNTIDNCFCPTIFIYSLSNEGTITNCKLWASNFIASIYFNTNSNWIVDNNQFVGGSKGAIYIPDNNTLHNIRITNNYFDGSRYNIDTHNGIYTEIETSSNTTVASIERCIIANNLFWHQKERGIYIKARDCIICNNVFDDCDNWNYGIEDININCLFCSNIISGNIFSRLKYHNRENSAEEDRITSDSESFTRPVCIVISNGYEETVAIITNNFVRNKDAYNEVQFGSNGRAYISYNNSVIIPNYGYTRPTSQLPLKPTQGDTFYNNSLHRTVIWDSRWTDGRGYPVTSLLGTTEERPTSGTNGILKTYDVGYMYFDTTLGKPIWWTGTKWIDSTGATV